MFCTYMDSLFDGVMSALSDDGFEKRNNCFDRCEYSFFCSDLGRPVDRIQFFIAVRDFIRPQQSADVILHAAFWSPQRYAKVNLLVPFAHYFPKVKH